MLLVETLILTLSRINKRTFSYQWGFTSSYQRNRISPRSSSGQQRGQTDRRQQFMNYCLTHPAKFSCAVECFLELNYAIFKDFLRHTERNEFFKVLICTSCDNTIVKKTNIFVLYITSANVIHRNFENYVSEAILLSTAAVICVKLW